MNKLYCLLGIFIIFIMNGVIAKELGELSAQTQNEIIKTQWVCEWKSSTLGGYNGEYVLMVEDISDTTISGKFDNTACPGETKFSGNFKKNKVSWNVKNQISPCHPLKVKAWFHRDESNQLVMKGGYSAQCPLGTGFQDSGPVRCQQW